MYCHRVRAERDSMRELSTADANVFNCSQMVTNPKGDQEQQVTVGGKVGCQKVPDVSAIDQQKFNDSLPD